MDNSPVRLDWLSAGDKFSYKGFNWIVLNEKEPLPYPFRINPFYLGVDCGVFAIMSNCYGDAIKNSVDKDNRCYPLSDIRQNVQELIPVLGGEMVLLPHQVKYGKNPEDTIYDSVFILPIEECLEYKKYLPEFLMYGMWTCSSGIDGVKWFDGEDWGEIEPSVEMFEVYPACVFRSDLIVKKLRSEWLTMVDKIMEDIKKGKGIPLLSEKDQADNGFVMTGFEPEREELNIGMMIAFLVILCVGTIVSLAITMIILWGFNWMIDVVKEIATKL